MKLIVFPLVILMMVALFSMLGLGSPTSFRTTDPLESTADDTVAVAEDGWYDINAHEVCDRWERDTGEAGGIIYASDHYYWLNESNVGTNGWTDSATVEAAGNAIYNYPIFDVFQNQTIAQRAREGTTISFDAASSYGLIALVVGIMALAAVVGLRVFGSGISEASASTILQGTAFLSLWAIFSVISLPLITLIPMSLGVLFYFILTGMYTLGILGRIGGGGGTE